MIRLGARLRVRPRDGTRTVRPPRNPALTLATKAAQGSRPGPEDCVNAVAVDLNTASPPLLARVSGLSATVAAGIVRWRDAHGAFRNRQQLREVAGLGAKTFEQAAGPLRIRDGEDPLDASDPVATRRSCCGEEERIAGGQLLPVEVLVLPAVLL